MRNAFVVLVSLCIGLVSGFIVPSSMPELSSKTDSDVDGIADSDILSTISTSKFVLPKSRSNIDEKDLYEHATVKQNNQSERAFIYINQKYKKPVRNNIFKVSASSRSDSGRIYTSSPRAVTVPHRLCKNGGILMDSGPVNSYFQGYEFPEKQTQDIASYFVPPAIFRCNFNEKKPNNAVDKVKAHSLNKDDERREYFELLKPPILRPVHRGNNKAANFDSLSQHEFSSLASSSIPYRDYYLRKYNIKNQYLPKQKVIEERPTQLRKNFGFSRPYTHHPIFQNKELLHRAEDVNFEGDFVNEDDPHRGFESNQEEDKLLDKYLKDTLEEQGGIHDKSNSNQIQCSYRDCILKTTKQYTNSGLLLKPDCKCGRRLNIKQVDPFAAKDRSLREDGKHNDTISKSAEINYYEELLADDSNSNKFDDDVIRPPSKLNETLLD